MNMGENAILGLWPWLLLLGLMYFLLIRPQQKRERDRQKMLGELRVGDAVVTIGGIYGVITALREDEIHLEVADGLTITMTRGAVAGPQRQEKEQDA